MKKLILILSLSIIYLNCGEKKAHEEMGHEEMGHEEMGHEANCTIKNFMAELNTKEAPNKLTVMGKIMVYSDNAKIVFKKADLQGMNETILLMELSVKEDGPRKGRDEHIHYEESGDNLGKYKEVQVQGYTNCTTKIDMKG